MSAGIFTYCLQWNSPLTSFSKNTEPLCVSLLIIPSFRQRTSSFFFWRFYNKKHIFEGFCFGACFYKRRNLWFYFHFYGQKRANPKTDCFVSSLLFAEKRVAFRLVLKRGQSFFLKKAWESAQSEGILPPSLKRLFCLLIGNYNIHILPSQKHIWYRGLKVLVRS